MSSPDPIQYKILRSFSGHVALKGASAGKIFNKYWRVIDNNNNNYNTDNIYYIAQVNKKTTTDFFKFSESSLKVFHKIESFDNPSWYVAHNGYVCCTAGGKTRYLHQHIMQHFGNGKGQDSVDHINMDKLDNRLSNLRITNQTQQNMNQSKRTRTASIANLAIPISEIPSLIHYVPAKVNHGELFEVSIVYYENNIRKRLRKKTSKSSDKSLIEKLIQAIEIRQQFITQYPDILHRKIDGFEFNSIDALVIHDNKLLLKLNNKRITKSPINKPKTQTQTTIEKLIEPNNPSIDEYTLREQKRGKLRCLVNKGKKENCPDCNRKISKGTLARHQKKYCHNNPNFNEAEFQKKKELANIRKSISMTKKT